MSDTEFATTPNFGFTLPDPGADDDIWGEHLNGNWSQLDGLLPNYLPIADFNTEIANYLPLAGGVPMQGPLLLDGAAPTDPNEAVSKSYVDNFFAGELGIDGPLTIGPSAEDSLYLAAATATEP